MVFEAITATERSPKMQYLLSVIHDENGYDAPAEEMELTYKQVGIFNDELIAAKAMVFGGGLTPASKAKTYRHKGSDLTLVDGPFAETKEQMGGFLASIARGITGGNLRAEYALVPPPMLSREGAEQ